MPEKQPHNEAVNAEDRDARPPLARVGHIDRGIRRHLRPRHA
jgi:hypothetical protein